MVIQEIKLPFSDQEYTSRVERVREQMEQRGLDILLVTVAENYFYLTGFQTGLHQSFIVLALPLKGEPAWILRKTELSNVRAYAPVCWVKRGHGMEDSQDPIEFLASVLRQMGHERSRVGMEEEGYFFNISFYLRLKKELPHARFADGSNIVEALRRVKSESELRYMRQAAQITAKALKAGIEALSEGVTDTEIGSILLSTATLEGSETMCSGPFVTAGPRSAQAHSSWIGSPVRRGEIVDTEMVAVVARYNAPIFRVSVVGEPSDEVRRIHDASVAGLEAGLSGFKPGMPSGEADRIVREAVEKRGHGQYFVVRAAYSIGLGFSPGWSENNIMVVRPNDPRPLMPGMCFHLVPALYKDGLGAVCCSLPAEITDTGCAPLYPVELLEPKLFVR